MRKNVSGQYLYFSLISAISGNPVTGASGAISGRKSLDGLSGMIVLSGNIIELGGGSYRANLYDFDTNGNQVGYLFTASGAVPVQYQFDMIDGNASGAVWPASGVNVTVPIASISGNISNSGLFTTVLPANLSGVVANSGLNVNADVIRWRNTTPNILLASGRLDAAFSVRTNVARSGTSTTIQLDASTPTGTSGIFDGDLITIVGGSGAGETRRIAFYDSSGNVTVDRAWTVAAFADSIFTITPDANPQSGRNWPASGVNAVVPISSISGLTANSGLTVTVIPATISGVFAFVPISTLSGVVANSGLFTTVLPANLSGVVANSGLNVEANLVRWLTKVPKPLVASGHVDAYPAIYNGPVVSGTASTIQLNGAPTGTSGVLDGCVITLVEGLGKGQSRLIRNWGSSGIALIDPPWTVVPETTEFYIVTPTTRTASGVEFPSLPKAALSGVVANSGLFVTATATVDKDTISGVFATVPKETLSGVVANSGLFVTATAVVQSGVFVTVPIDTISGVFSVVPKATLSGVVANSGLVTQAQLMDGVVHGGTTASIRLGGTTSTPPFFVTNSGGDAVQFTSQGANGDGCQILGHGAGAGLRLAEDTGGISFVTANAVIANTLGIAALSVTGTTTLTGAVSATNAGNDIRGVTANSGVFATVPKATLSGVVANSGLFVVVLPANISGVNAIVPPDNLSGVFSTVLPANLSGVVANSGIFATVLPANLSGVVANSGLTVTVIKSTLSGVVANSGLFVNAAVVATVASGELYLASGSLFVNTFSSGTLNEIVLARNLSGIESVLPAQSVGAAALKLTSRFNARSGATYNADGTTVFMTQEVTTASSQQPIVELGVGEK